MLRKALRDTAFTNFTRSNFFGFFMIYLLLTGLTGLAIIAYLIDFVNIGENLTGFSFIIYSKFDLLAQTDTIPPAAIDKRSII